LTLRVVAAELIAIAALMLTATVSAAFPNPILDKDRRTEDPGVLFDGGAYYVASTGGLMPIRSSRTFPADPRNWDDAGSVLGQAPAWADPSCSFWAPDIYPPDTFRPNVGLYVAYYSGVPARTRGRGGPKPKKGQCRRKKGERRPDRCIGRATSKQPNGPFVDDSNPLCGSGAGRRTIDPALFVDPKPRPGAARLYLLYKNDPPRNEGTKEIVIRSIPDDGALRRKELGPARHILRPTQPWEGRSVEAPTMVYNEASSRPYYLFYSGNSYRTDKYAVGIARSNSPLGLDATGDPDTQGRDFEKRPVRESNNPKPANPILSADRDTSFCGAGHQDVVPETSLMFYHAYGFRQEGQPPQDKEERCLGFRRLMVDTIKWEDGWPNVNDGTPSNE
jgi:beta-xylosidase